eukprot:SAG11_NODE_739_length_7425_cov_67.127082_3_plen_95_part_00
MKTVYRTFRPVPTNVQVNFSRNMGVANRIKLWRIDLRYLKGKKGKTASAGDISVASGCLDRRENVGHALDSFAPTARLFGIESDVGIAVGISKV